MQQWGYNIEVITTGDEILFGRIMDTNSSWIARRSAELGARLRRVTCVGDDVDEIVAVLMEALRRKSDLIIFTGGLGPSEDDLTVEAIGRAVCRNIIMDQGSLEKIRRIYAERGIHSTTRGERMARILDGSEAISNPIGMATGLKLDEGGTTIIALPGVQDEMKAMFDEYIAPLIEEKSTTKFVAKTVTVRMVFKDFFPMYRQMQHDHPDVYIKNVATPPESLAERLKVKDIKVHIVAEGPTREESEGKMDAILEEFRIRIDALDGELLMG